MLTKIKLLLSVFITIVLFSCESEKQSNIIVCNVKMYYLDTVSLTKLVGDTVINLIQDKPIFAIDKHNLYVKNTSLIDKAQYVIKLNNKEITVCLKFWIEKKYSLNEDVYDDRRPILTKNDTTFYFINNTLNYSVRNISSQHSCGMSMIPDMLYNQMVAENGYYAIRLGANIYISTDLKNWIPIFDKKRGITEMMVMFKNRNSGDMELIWGDYTAGTDRVRHYVYKYNFRTKNTIVKKIFYTEKENDETGLTPFARHIHVISRDPYTGDIYIGTGDTDRESAIYRSVDDGESFKRIGGGAQMWRTLSFIFTEKSVFWNTDSHEPQYLTRVDKNKINNGRELTINEVVRFPLINSALWGNQKIEIEKDKFMYVMNSSAEGAIIDNWCRTYGITIVDEVPIVYELYKIAARNWSTQLFLCGVDNEGIILLCDHEINNFRKFKIVRND